MTRRWTTTRIALAGTALAAVAVTPLATSGSAGAVVISGARSIGDRVIVQFPGAGSGPTTDVHVLGFNDFHGNLEASSSLRQYGTYAGGAANLASSIAAKRTTYGAGNTATVMAGDAIGATPLISASFAEEPSIIALNHMGLDFASVGNHEFDRGSTELLRVLDGCASAPNPATCSLAKTRIDADNIANGTSNPSNYAVPGGAPTPVYPGANFEYLSTNVRTTAVGPLAENTLLPAHGIKNLGGIPVGFIGLTLQSTPSIVSPGGVAGLTFDAEVASANAAATQLKTLGAKTIVMVIHQGGFQTPAPSASGGAASLNTCNGQLSPAANPSNGQFFNIVGPGSGLDPDIGVVISGHTHTEYVCTITDGSRSRLITSASAFGRVLTDVTLTISNDTGELKGAVAVNSIVQSSSTAFPTFTPLPGDPATAAVVAQYKAAVAAQANAPVGRITADVNKVTAPLGEMKAGDLIADAQLAATSGPTTGGAQIAFMNSGGVRDPGLIYAQSGTEGDGVVTYGEAFTMQPFYNYLVTKTMTGAQIRSLLEQQFIGCGGQSTQRILQPSAGFRYEQNAAAPTCAGKIGLIQLNGIDLDPGSSYRVTMNSFLYGGGDGFTTFTQAPQDGIYSADFDIDALVRFMQPTLAGTPYTPLALNTVAPVVGTDPNRIVSIGTLVSNPVPQGSPLVLFAVGTASALVVLVLIARRRTYAASL